METWEKAHKDKQIKPTEQTTIMEAKSAAGGMVRRLRALAARSEDSRLIPSTCMAAHHHL